VSWDKGQNKWGELGLKKVLPWLVPALVLFGLVVWRFMGRGEAQQVSQQQGKKKPATVRIAPATGRLMVQSLQSVGNVESPYKIEISPKSAGRIEYLEAREGDVVSAGQIILKIDPSDLQGAVLQQEAAVAEARSRLAQAKMTEGSTNVGISSQIRQQRAGLGSVQANLTQAQENFEAQVAAADAQVSAAKSALANSQASLAKETASLRNLQTKCDRTKSLYQQGYIAAQDLDDAITAVDVQKGAVEVAKGMVDSAASLLEVQKQNLQVTKRKGVADIAAAKALVDQGQSTLQVAEANRSQTPAYQQSLSALQSQVDAAVSQLNQASSRLADTVIRSSITGTVTARKTDPGALATPGTPVLEVQFLDWLYVTATVPIESAALVREGQTANITIDAMPGRTFTGVITNVNPAADTQNRQFGVKVRLNNPDHKLRPGMYARTTILTGRVDAKVVVLKEAIQTALDGAKTVTVVDSGRIAHIRSVKLGVSDERGYEVLEGVLPGEQVVVLTFNALKDGQAVTVETPADPGSNPQKAKGLK
jgi:RND family efflux transporter MFP subunit